MAVPKSKVSKQRRDKRRANWKLAAPAVTTCPKCGSTETEKLLSACASHTKGGAVSTTSVTSANGSSGCSGCSGGSCASCGGCAH